MTLLLSLILAASSVTPPVPLGTPPAVAPPGTPQGVVILLCTIGTDGAVKDVNVAQSAGQALDGAAIAAVLRWTFRPAVQDGQPVEARVRIPFTFVVAPPGQAPPVPGSQRPGGPSPPLASPAPPASQPPPTPQTPPEAQPEVTVRGRRKQVQRGASDFDIDVGSLAIVPHRNAEELLQLAPGIYLANEGGEGHAEQVFLRGFDAAEGQAIEFTVNGVPINEVDNPDSHGYADTHFIIPEVVKELRVTEGPFDPHQGDFAVAGSADYVLGVQDRGLRLVTSLGSYGTRRVLGLWAPPGERTGTFGAVSLFQSDGFGANRASQYASAMAQYEGELGSRGLFRLLATSYATHYRSAGVLRRDVVDSGQVDFYGTLDASQGGDAIRQGVSFDLESPLGNGDFIQQTFLTFRTLRIVENFTGFLLDDQETGQSIHPQRGDAVEKDYQALTAGGRAAYRLRFSLLGRESSVELGFYARYDQTTPKIQRLRFGTQIPYAIDQDLETEVMNIAGYLDLDLHLAPFLVLRGGLRPESFTYSVLDRCDTLGNFRTGQPLDVTCPAFDRSGPRQPARRITATGQVVEPKVTALVSLPWGLTLTASAGVGAQSLDPTSLQQDENAPFVKLTAFEAGALAQKRLGNFDTTARLVAYQTRTGRDLIFNPDLGRLAPSSATTRTGIVAAARARSASVDESISFTATHPVFDDDGALVPYTPLWVARSDTGIQGTLPGLRLADHPLFGEAGLGLGLVGKRALPLGKFSDPTVQIDASVAARWQALKLGVGVTNLLDTRFPLSEFFYASDFRTRPYPTLAPAEHFTAGPPRIVLFTLTVLLEREGE